MNNVLLVGRLGQDPEVRYTAGGNQAVGKLSIATDEHKKNANGEWEKYPEWHKIVIFGKDAENAKKYLAKGSQVCVQGSLKTNKWTDKDGVDRWTTEVIAHRVEYLSSPQEKTDTQDRGRRGGGGRDGEKDVGEHRENYGGSAPQPPLDGEAFPRPHRRPSDGVDDDIPF